MASAVAVVADGTIVDELCFGTAAGRSLTGCACVAGIAVALIVADAADVVTIEPALEPNLIDLPVCLAVD